MASVLESEAEVLVERERCPACEETSRRTLYRASFLTPPLRDYLVGFYPQLPSEDLALLAECEYVLEECSACGLIWQRFAPGRQLLVRIYGTWAAAASGGPLRHDTLAYQRAAVEEILLALELAGRPPSQVSVLDFGMGWGRWPRVAAAFGCRAAGVEVDDTAAAFAGAHGVEVFALEELPERSFDFVNCEQVFEHLVDPRSSLAALSRSLAPDGWLKLGVPDGRRVRRLIRNPDWAAPKGTRRSLNAVAPLEHLNCFTVRSLDLLAERSGLRRVPPAWTPVRHHRRALAPTAPRARHRPPADPPGATASGPLPPRTLNRRAGDRRDRGSSPVPGLRTPTRRTSVVCHHRCPGTARRYDLAAPAIQADSTTSCARRSPRICPCFRGGRT
jgi:SAM-dependent methyltransferase